MGVGDEVVIILLLTGANGFFSATEIAMLAVRKSALAARAEAGSRGARIALRLRAQPERFLATVQVGITLVGATAAAFGGATLAQPAAEWLVARGAGADVARQAALLVVVGAVSALSIVLGELVPKSLALRHAEGLTIVAAPLLAAVAWAARPVVWALTLASNVILRPFGDSTTFGEARFSPEEIQQLVEEAATEGTVNRHAGELASRALELPELRIAAVRVPRGDVVAVRRDHLREDLVAALSRTPHDRYPVVGDSLDDAVGYVVVREIATALTEGELGARVRPVTFVPESSRALDVMREMQRTASHLALVVDDQGGVAGLVTLGDLLEELVGETLGEGETASRQLRREQDGTVLASGTVGVHELNRALSLDLPDDGAASIAGLLIERAGRIPPVGATVEIDGVRVDVVEATPRRVLGVRVHPKLPLAAPGA